MRFIDVVSFFIALCFGFLGGNLSAQDFKTEMARINKSYLNTRDLTVNVTMKYYNSSDKNSPVKITQGVMNKQGDVYWSKFGNIERVKDPNAELLIDLKSKIIAVNEPKPANTFLGSFINIDTLLKIISEIRTVPVKGGVGGYILILKKTQIASILINYNSANYYLNSIIINYRQPSQNNPRHSFPLRNEIFYTGFSTQPQVHKITSQTFVIKNQGHFKLSNSFRQYKLMQQKS